VDVGGATVTLDALALAHGEPRGLRFAERSVDGLAGEGALSVDCPACARPFVVALQHVHAVPIARLMAVRTAADLALAMTPRRGGDPSHSSRGDPS
jgi:hypothetical protein